MLCVSEGVGERLLSEADGDYRGVLSWKTSDRVGSGDSLISAERSVKDRNKG
jgi:hypothetical protein